MIFLICIFNLKHSSFSFNIFSIIFCFILFCFGFLFFLRREMACMFRGKARQGKTSQYVHCYLKKNHQRKRLRSSSRVFFSGHGNDDVDDGDDDTDGKGDVTVVMLIVVVMVTNQYCSYALYKWLQTSNQTSLATAKSCVCFWILKKRRVNHQSRRISWKATCHYLYTETKNKSCK